MASWRSMTKIAESGSTPKCHGSGTLHLTLCRSIPDPGNFGVDPDPRIMPLSTGSVSGCGSGSCYFRHWPSRRHQKLNFLKRFSAFYFNLHHFSKIKVQQKSQNSRNQGFSYYFCLMIEGYGSGRPKNIWIRNTVLSEHNSLWYTVKRGKIGHRGLDRTNQKYFSKTHSSSPA